MEFVSEEFSFSKLETASFTLFFKDNSEIKDCFLISSFNLINSLFSELILFVHLNFRSSSQTLWIQLQFYFYQIL